MTSPTAFFSESPPHASEQIAVHGLETTASAVDQNPKVLATGVDGEKGESRPLFVRALSKSSSR
jgi:hypothetical protein